MSATRRAFIASAAALVGHVACRPAQFLGPAPRTEGALDAPSGAEPDLVEHVLARCTFGPRGGDRQALRRLGATEAEAVAAWLERQLAPRSLDDGAAQHVLRRFASLEQPAGELYEFKPQVLRQDLASAAVLAATLSERQLFEVMVEFWSDHFNVDLGKGECAWLKAWDDREVVRAHALGRFRELLQASALSPAMLWYLDGRLNRRSGPAERPNENYARELLELHTLGVDGGYTQRDVMEVARCLTGWTVRPKGGFHKGRVEFRAAQHDDGEKLVLGVSIPAGQGRADLLRVLDIVAAHPATARHLAHKLCARFLADDPPRAAVEAVASAFRASSGDLRATLRALFACPEFTGGAGEPELLRLRRAKLKRPFHYLVSALRATGAESDGGAPLTDFLVAMGQAPFQCPTPDGYPAEAQAWTGTLLWRWRFAAALAGNEIPGTRLDAERLLGRAGGDPGLMSHLLGRRARPEEQAAYRRVGSGRQGLALILASPAFQRC